MKVRYGFVSNSSSSSFIIAVAKVADKRKLEGWLKTIIDHKTLDWHSIGVRKLHDIPFSDDEDDCCGYAQRVEESNRLQVVCLNDDFTVELKTKKMSELDEVFIVAIVNDEGDPDFYTDADYYYEEYPMPNWDIDICFFDSWQQKLFHDLNDKKDFTGLKDIHVKFGAGRNG